MTFKDSDYLHIKRVEYGKNGTPKNLREYRLANIMASPVGFVEEWKKFAKLRGHVGLKIEEQDGKIRYEELH